MPISVNFLFETKLMTPDNVKKWLARDGFVLPTKQDDVQRVLSAYLTHRNITYGFLRQRQFILDLADHAEKGDWGLTPRQRVRLANFIRTFATRNTDYTGNPVEDDHYLHPVDVTDLNRGGRGLILEHLSAGEMFDVCNVLVVGETHKRQTATKYLHISHAYLGGVQKYEIRVLLDGLDQKRDRFNQHMPLNRVEVGRNFPNIGHLCDHYTFYGLEPVETSMFTLCEKIDRLAPEAQRRAAEWFYLNLREDEEFSKAVKQRLGNGFYNLLMDDANELASSSKPLPRELASRVKLASEKVEFANRSSIRMDGNVAWGQAIEEILAIPPTGALEVRVLVLCGTNHTLSRSLYGVPVQGAIKRARVRVIVIEDAGSSDLEYRQLDTSTNFVFTVPESFVDLNHYFAKPPF